MSRSPSRNDPGDGETRGRIRRQLADYLTNAMWVALDGGRRYPARIALILVLNVLGVGTATVSLGGILLYARQLATGQPVGFKGVEVQLPSEPPGLVLVAASLAALGAASALLIYRTDWMIARTAINYQIACSRRILRIVADPACRGWQAAGDGESGRSVSRLAGMTSKISAMIFRFMLRGMLPILVFVTAMVMLVLVSPMMTGLLLPVAALYLVPLYLVNRGAARSQRAYHETSPRARRLIGEGLEIAADSATAPAERQAAIDEIMARDVHRAAGTLFFKRRLADAAAQLVNTVFFVLAVLVLFLFFTVRAEEGRDWSALLAYLVALRFAVGGLRGVTKILVKLSRFLPEYRRHRRFIVGVEAMRRRRAALAGQPWPARLRVRLGGRRVGGGPNRVTLRQGALHWLIAPWSPDLDGIERAVVHLEPRLTEDADLLGGGTFVSEPGGSLESDAPRPLLAVSSEVLRSDPSALRGAAAERFVFVVTDDLEAPLRCAEPADPATVVIVLGDRRPLGGGDPAWLREALEELRGPFERARSEGHAAADDAELELEMDEE